VEARPRSLVMSNKPASNQEPDPNVKKQVQYNRRARHEYFIDETFDAGLALVGTEVKSIRAGKVNLQDSFCKIQNGEIWVHGMHIAPFEHGTHWNVEPVRPRKLLLHRREIDHLRIKMEQKGLALIPLALYFQHGYAKLEIGLARGKKLYDKREDMAKRDANREIDRALAGRE
jgi:SsrA-binding protein